MDRIVSGFPPELGNRLLQAGAGAGKTTTLIATFLDFVAAFRARNGGEFPRIVITTFTRKATQEVKERLMRKALENGDEEVFRYLGSRSRVHISTIHGVLSMFLSRFGHRIGLSPDFRIAGSDELMWLGRRELRRLLGEDPEGLALLEDNAFTELWRAIESWRESAGSETEARFADGEFFRARTLERMTKLRSEALSLAAEIPGASKNAKWLEWAELLGTFAPALATDDEGIEAFLDRLTNIDDLMDRPRVAAGKNKLVDEAVGARFKEFIAESWDPLVDPEKGRRFRPSSWRAHDERCALFERLARNYKSRLDGILVDRGLLSMADLERRSLEIVRLDPSAARAFAEEWDYWMIDEYQDTSPVQVELLKALVGDRPHFVVGDPQQSIYFFRGARSEVFFEKKADFEGRLARVERIAANHRSRPPLLELFNDFFSANPAFQPMEARSLKPPQPELPAGEIRIVDPIEGNDACVLAVVERIQELLASGAPAESICVLARKNAPLKRILDEARRRHLPVQLHTAGGFSERREIKDAAAFLRFLLNPADNLNLVSLLRSPWFHLADDEILRFCANRPTSYWNEALKVHAAAEESHPIKRLAAWLVESGEKGLAWSLREFYRREGVLDSAALADPSGRREANLWKLLMQLDQAQRQPGFNGLSFTRGFERGFSTEDGGEDGDAAPAVEPKRVNLMTVHASKGLEFEHVIVTHLQGLRGSEGVELFQYDEDSKRWTLAERDLSGKKIGSILSQEIVDRKNRRQEEESARVLYVALTRAMTTVTLVWENGRAASDRRSWSSIVPFKKEEGTHDESKYLYRVRTAPPVPSDGTVGFVAPSALPAKWLTGPSTSPRVLSPTALLEMEMGSATETRRLGPEAAAKGLRVAQRGTDAHRLFEGLKYAEPADVRAMTADESLRKAVDWIAAAKAPPFARIIREGHAEWGFAVRGEGFILQGQVDLWGEVDGTVWLVDYKTGSLEHAEKALDQLAIYAWALLRLRRLRPDQPVRLVAVYPLEEKTSVRSFAKAEDLGPDWTRLLPAK